MTQQVKRFGMLVLLVMLGLQGVGHPQPPEFQITTPSVLKVCLGCTYGSIQAAVDAAQPEDVIEVYPPYPISPAIQHAWLVDEVMISKPITLEAKPLDFAEGLSQIIIVPRYLPRPGEGSIFKITAESGQVIIRGFVFIDGIIIWSGQADLLLERNRFERLPPGNTAVVLGGLGRATLIDNKINGGGINIYGAHAYLKSNRIQTKEEYAISISYEGQKRQSSNVVLEQNLIEGGAIRVGTGNQVRMEDNILIGGLGPVNEQSPRWGVVFSADVVDEKGELRPIILEANRNVIIRYQKGVAVGYYCDETALLKALQIKGQDNVIEQNGQDFCPADYPWPPGFRK